MHAWAIDDPAILRASYSFMTKSHRNMTFPRKQCSQQSQTSIHTLATRTILCREVFLFDGFRFLETGFEVTVSDLVDDLSSVGHFLFVCVYVIWVVGIMYVVDSDELCDRCIG